MTIFLPLLQFNNLTGLGLFATLCHSPNPSEFMLIVAEVTGILLALGVFVTASAFTVLSLATTIVGMIIAGATLEAIAGAIAAQLGPASISLGVVSQLVEQIKPTFRRYLNRIDGYKFKKFKPEVIVQ